SYVTPCRCCCACCCCHCSERSLFRSNSRRCSSRSGRLCTRLRSSRLASCCSKPRSNSRSNRSYSRCSSSVRRSLSTNLSHRCCFSSLHTDSHHPLSVIFHGRTRVPPVSAAAQLGHHTAHAQPDQGDGDRGPLGLQAAAPGPLSACCTRPALPATRPAHA